MINRKSDVWKLFWNIAPILAFAILVMVFIMAAPSIDTIIWGR